MTATVVPPNRTHDQTAEWDMPARFRMVERACAPFGTDSSHRARGMMRCGENSDAVPVDPIGSDHISPELALVDPELASRARARLADPAPPSARLARPTPEPAQAPASQRAYPFWARVTAALWLVVLGILIGGAAIPHAQDKPRVVPMQEDPTFCPAAEPSPNDPADPGR